MVPAPDLLSVRVERSEATLAADVRTASSLWGRFRGLMGRAGLAPGEALWLPGDVSIHMLFMRFPIDAVFLAAEQELPLRPPSVSEHGPRGAGRWRVVAIRERLRPWTGVVWYVRGARGCLEVAAGTAAGSGLHVGDVLAFEERAPTQWPTVTPAAPVSEQTSDRAS